MKPFHFLFLLFSISLFAQEEQYDVFLVAGQSNTLHGCCKDPELQEVDSLIFQLGRYDEEDLQVIEAVEPLAHHQVVEDRIGFVMTFARHYAHEMMESGRKVLIVPCGKGGSGFISDHWRVGNPLYQDAVERTNYVLEKYPNATLKAIFWQQGERDTRENNKDFRRHLDNMITQMRKDIKTADQVPFIMGGMVPYWVAQKERREKFQQYVRKTSDRLENVHYVSPYDPFTIRKRDNQEDEIHYDAKGQIEMGNRYFSVYRKVSRE